MATISKLATPSFVASSSIRSDRLPVGPNRYVPVRSVAAPVRLSIRSNNQRRCLVYALSLSLSVLFSCKYIKAYYFVSIWLVWAGAFLHVFSWGDNCCNRLNMIKFLPKFVEFLYLLHFQSLFSLIVCSVYINFFFTIQNINMWAVLHMHTF